MTPTQVPLLLDGVVDRRSPYLPNATTKSRQCKYINRSGASFATQIVNVFEKMLLDRLLITLILLSAACCSLGTNSTTDSKVTKNKSAGKVASPPKVSRVNVLSDNSVVKYLGAG